LACHLQIDADPDPAYHFDVDPDPTFLFDPDPDSHYCQEDIHLVPCAGSAEMIAGELQQKKA
jgi:hypothetical protein